MVRKAKDKATQAVAPKNPAVSASQGGDDKVVFDDVILELNGERLDHILAAFQASCEIRAPRAGLVEKVNKLNNQRSDLMDKYGEAMRENRNQRGEKEACYHDAYGKAQDQKMQDYRSKALTDPALRQKFTEAAAKYNEAAARGDSTAQAKLNEILMSEVMLTKADSANARKPCGPMPALHPAQTQLDQLDSQVESLNNQIRDIDEKIAKAQSKDGGLNRQQWAMALERIGYFVGAMDNGGGGGKSKKDAVQSPKGFTPGELEAMEKRLSQLRSALRDQC